MKDTQLEICYVPAAVMEKGLNLMRSVSLFACPILERTEVSLAFFMGLLLLIFPVLLERLLYSLSGYFFCF